MLEQKFAELSEQKHAICCLNQGLVTFSQHIKNDTESLSIGSA